MSQRQLAVRIVQQGVWDMPLESMPLAAGYLTASALADPVVAAGADVRIQNFRGGMTHVQMADALFADGAPDVLAFSVLGWNARAFGALAETFKQLNPDGLVVFGGTHVSHQGERVFRFYPHVDLVVNGEGEVTFTQLLRAYMSGVAPHDMGDVAGLSWRAADGSVVTTAERARIEDLGIIPSPLLTGVIDLLDEEGRFRYDVALIETNRGCPYRCAFCYWGGAVGQRVRAFSRERLREELELLGRLQVHTVVACDANFGMLPIDIEFVDDFIEVKRRYGFPRAFETSWAKNKSKTFYTIVARMKEAGLRSSFTLALQSLSPATLTTMNRRNMRVNDWQDLATRLDELGMDCYAELIWGAPDETVESFLHGYDELARRVSRIAVYPMMLLPNTEYSEHRERYGIISIRGDYDDFEYVLAHRTMTFNHNRRVLRFMFWARVLAENAVLRHIWVALRELAGLAQGTLIDGFADWVDRTPEPAAAPLRRAVARSHGGGAPAFAEAVGYLFTDGDGETALRRWWADVVRPLLPAAVAPLLEEVFRYDILTRPVCPDGESSDRGQLPPVELIDGERYHVRHGVAFSFDVPAALVGLRTGRCSVVEPEPTEIDLYYRVGALNAVRSTNHEEIVHFMGMPGDTLRALSPPGFVVPTATS